MMYKQIRTAVIAVALTIASFGAYCQYIVLENGKGVSCFHDKSGCVKDTFKKQVWFINPDGSLEGDNEYMDLRVNVSGKMITYQSSKSRNPNVASMLVIDLVNQTWTYTQSRQGEGYRVMPKGFTTVIGDSVTVIPVGGKKPE